MERYRIGYITEWRDTTGQPSYVSAYVVVDSQLNIPVSKCFTDFELAWIVARSLNSRNPI